MEQPLPPLLVAQPVQQQQHPQIEPQPPLEMLPQEGPVYCRHCGGSGVAAAAGTGASTE
jgi:hypothetical protein